MTSPQGRRLDWAQLSARVAPPAGAAAAARGSKGVLVTRDSRPSLPTPRPISPARGAGRLPPPWDHLPAPLSPSSRGQDRGPSLLPTDPLPTPPCRVSRQGYVPVHLMIRCWINEQHDFCIIKSWFQLEKQANINTPTRSSVEPNAALNFTSRSTLFDSQGNAQNLLYISEGNCFVPPNKRRSKIYRK